MVTFRSTPSSFSAKPWVRLGAKVRFATMAASFELTRMSVIGRTVGAEHRTDLAAASTSAFGRGTVVVWDTEVGKGAQPVACSMRSSTVVLKRGGTEVRRSRDSSRAPPGHLLREGARPHPVLVQSMPASWA